MKHTVPESGNGEAHWVGLDVSKKTFDAALAWSNQRFPSTPVRELPWRAFPRTRAGGDFSFSDCRAPVEVPL